VLRCRM